MAEKKGFVTHGTALEALREKCGDEHEVAEIHFGENMAITAVVAEDFENGFDFVHWVWTGAEWAVA
jgi:hypothetical protein